MVQIHPGNPHWPGEQGLAQQRRRALYTSTGQRVHPRCVPPGGQRSGTQSRQSTPAGQFTPFEQRSRFSRVANGQTWHPNATNATRERGRMEIGVSHHYNEALEADGAVREPYGPLMDMMERLGPGMLAERRARAGAKLRELGATFPLPGDAAAEEERILPADWIPRIVPREHWTRLSAGLLQRGRAINAWLTDLQDGEGNVVPQEIVESSRFRDRLRPLL